MLINLHEPGTITLLERIASQSGVSQGESMLTNLATHKDTKHLVDKLCQHFIGDTPKELSRKNELSYISKR
ncbi:DUF1800 family protein [Vibrio lentus]|nr:DUF1800 family protein [Vibrio lentus]